MCDRTANTRRRPVKVKVAVPLVDLGATPEEAGERLAAILDSLRARVRTDDEAAPADYCRQERAPSARRVPRP